MFPGPDSMGGGMSASAVYALFGHFCRGPVKCPWQRREMAISTNNGLVNGLVHNLLMQFFTLGSSKIEVFETCFFYVVTTQYDHPSYVKHVLGRIYMFFTLFGS